ncbi:FxLYD domain-containing protein [Streptomyces sp. NPDC057623]|uniref:FxLYD domain-containing protein n=1 Tax=Streptomyces sp. NPDC057623 TaxID=3346187 RepID=UPI0036CF3BE2
MPGHRTRWTTAAILTTTATMAAALTLTSCSDEDTPSSVASQAASVFASATAEAGRELDDIKGGVNAKDAVRLGTPTTDSDGRTTVEVTAQNTTDSTKSFAVQVNFRNENGDLLDAAVVSVSDVAGGGTGKATARSTHDLSGEVKAEVARALRH